MILHTADKEITCLLKLPVVFRVAECQYFGNIGYQSGACHIWLYYSILSRGRIGFARLQISFTLVNIYNYS